MLSRLGSGLNLGGMLSHVALPMTTAFMLPSGAPLVMRLKNDISLGSRQGSCELRPMPLLRVAATIMVKRVMVDGDSEHEVVDVNEFV